MDGFYKAMSDEALADSVARLERLKKRIDALLGWRKSVLANRMRADGVKSMKTPGGTLAKFVPRYRLETTEEIVGDRLAVG